MSGSREMTVDLEKLRTAATLIRSHRSTIQVTPETEWLAEYAFGPFQELAYGSTKEAARDRSFERVAAKVERFVDLLASVLKERI